MIRFILVLLFLLLPLRQVAAQSTFDDEFTGLSLHQNWTGGDNWGIGATFDGGLGQGGPWLGDFGHQWWLNPFNSSTSFSSCGTDCYANRLYQISGGGLELGLLPTPTAMQSYINTQSQCSTTPNPSVCADAGNGFGKLPYIGAILNSQNINTQQFGYYEIKAAVDKLAGFDFQWDLESLNLTTNSNNPPEIDLFIYTDGSGVMHTHMQIVQSYSPSFSATVLYDAVSPAFDPSVSHTYGIDWQSTGIKFYVDGVQQGSVAMSSLPAVYASGNPMFGYLLSAANYHSGVDPAPASLPVFAHVDYYRVYTSKPASGAPEPAAAVGYNQETFGPNLKLGLTPDPVTSYPQFSNGANWVPYTFTGTSWTNIGVVQNGDGSVTLDGTGEAFGNGISTAAAGNPNFVGDRLSFTGKAFGGGGYFQAVMKFTGPASFWANDIETMNGASVNAGPYPWPGQGPGYGDWMEADFAEFDATNLYGIALHNWYNTIGSNIQSHSVFGNPTPSPTPDYTQYNTFGFLWVPATASTQGYAKYFFHPGDCSAGCTGYTQVGTTLTWNKYNSSLAPPPTPATTTTGGGSTFSVMDNLHLALILGAQTGGGDTNTIKNVQVWQLNDNNNLPPSLGSIACTTTTCNGAALPAGYEVVAGNQIKDGAGNNLRWSCVQMRDQGGSAAAIRAAGFNCVRISYRDDFMAHDPGGSYDCSSLNSSAANYMDKCVNAATAAGLKVIIDHHGNETPQGASNACWGQQENGLWYDLNGPAPYNITDGTDGCGDTGTITYAKFKQNWVAIATHYANNSTVIGADLHNEPIVYGCCTTQQVNWGSGGGGGGNFTVSNGQMFAPDGSVFHAFGVNITDDQLANATPAQVLAFAPKLNMIRLAAGADCGPPLGFGCAQPFATIEAGARAYAAQHILVMIESHECNGGSPNANQIDATAEFNWYHQLASDLNNEPYVMFESGNECGTPGITAENLNVYNAVRSAGNNTPVAFEVAFASGPPDGPASTYAPMSNVLWTPHSYNNATGANTNQAQVNSIYTGWMNSGLNYVVTQTGRMPTLWSEVGFIDYAGVCGGQNGPGTAGIEFNCGTGQVVQAALSPASVGTGAVGGLIWLWYYPPCCAQQTDLVDRNNVPAKTDYGNITANLIAANSPGQAQPGGGGTNGADILAMANDVGAAIHAANPGVFVILEGPGTYTTLFSGYQQSTGVYDLSVVQTKPVTGVPANKMVYSIHDYPPSVGGNSQTDTLRTNAWGKVVTANFAPVWIGEMGCSCDGSNGDLTNDNAWATDVVAYLNGNGSAGGPTFTAGQQAVGTSWWSWGNNVGENPDGTQNADGTLKSGQLGYWSKLLFTPLSPPPTLPTTWNPADQFGMTLSNNNLTATGAAPISGVRASTSKSTGKYCWAITAATESVDFGTGLANGSWDYTSVGLGSDANDYGFYAGKAVPNGSIAFYNGVAVISSPTVPAMANGGTVTECHDFDAGLDWVTTPAMVQTYGSGAWNNSITCNPTVTACGSSTSGLVCPCFIAFHNREAGVAALNATGPLPVNLPSGFLTWDQPVISGRPIIMIFGDNDNQPRPANDDWPRFALAGGTRP